MQGSMMFSRMLGSTIAFLLVVLAVSFCKCFSCLYLSRDCFKQWWILIDLLLILADCFSCSVFLVLFIHLALLTSSHDVGARVRCCYFSYFWCILYRIWDKCELNMGSLFFGNSNSATTIPVDIEQSVPEVAIGSDPSTLTQPYATFHTRFVG
ncbi:unnamed protein product [Lactuca virosa]|uniref:Transmembrane protein n=1 Tax=Lactuca virosa TaxID=75947 RepID=A0AAU9PMI2_9ASTR|nr:unnamed protein product [Lactuca virosa]